MENSSPKDNEQIIYQIYRIGLFFAIHRLIFVTLLTSLSVTWYMGMLRGWIPGVCIGVALVVLLADISAYLYNFIKLNQLRPMPMSSLWAYFRGSNGFALWIARREECRYLAEEKAIAEERAEIRGKLEHFARELDMRPALRKIVVDGDLGEASRLVLAQNDLNRRKNAQIIGRAEFLNRRAEAAGVAADVADHLKHKRFEEASAMVKRAERRKKLLAEVAALGLDEVVTAMDDEALEEHVKFIKRLLVRARECGIEERAARAVKEEGVTSAFRMVREAEARQAVERRIASLEVEVKKMGRWATPPIPAKLEALRLIRGGEFGPAAHELEGLIAEAKARRGK